VPQTAQRAVLRAARAAYARTLHSLPTQASAWFDLGLASHRCAAELELQHARVAARAATHRRCAAAAVHCMRTATHLAPGNARLWSGLGAVAAHEPDEQRLALRRAVELDRLVCGPGCGGACESLTRGRARTPGPTRDWRTCGWASWPTVQRVCCWRPGLTCSCFRSAREAFAQAQLSNPETPHSWLGLGLLQLAELGPVDPTPGRADRERMEAAYWALAQALGLQFSVRAPPTVPAAR
jgi:hypothetical protein